MTRQIKPDEENRVGAESAAVAGSPANDAGEAGGAQSGKSKVDQTATNDGGTDGLSKLAAENVDLKDRLLRALAEAENVRRRAERDLKDMGQYAVAKFAGDMLNVANNFQRFIASIPAQARESDGAVKTLVEGIELTEKEMLRSLEKHGVKKLNPLGERFDPNFHEAMFAVPDPTLPNGTVTKVVEAGYSIGARALRPAKVGVSSGGPQSRSTPGTKGEPED